jgi:cell division control protein 6
LEKNSEIFLNENSLFPSYLPPKLLCRDREYNFLKSILKEFDFCSQSALIVGELGFGKTTLSNFVSSEILKKNSRIKYVPIACLECKKSFYQLLLKIIRSFIPNFPLRGYSLSELIKYLIYALKNSKSSVIVLIDDLEFLIDKNLQSIYNLSRFKESIFDEKLKICFIYTLGNENYLEKLNKEYVGFIKKNIIKLKKYSKGEIEEILAYRASLAFQKNKVQPKAIELIAQLASETGNLAYAIEILWRAGKYAEYEKAKQLIDKHVLKACNEVSPKIRHDLNKFLNFHEKLFLMAILKSLEKTSMSYVSIGEVKKVYEYICKEYNEKPRKHTQLWEYMHNLKKVGLVSLKLSGEGFRGKSTLMNFQPKTISTIKRLISM